MNGTDSTFGAYDFSGRTAVITGANRGLGRALAHGLARTGCRVIVNYLDNREQAREVVSEIESEGGAALSIQADISKPGEVKTLFRKAADPAGRIDFLINNAAHEVNKSSWEIEDHEWRRVLGSSLDGAFFCSKYVLPYMLPGDGGKIVNISSIHDTVPRMAAAPYCVSKAGLLMLTRVLALELAPHNIQVNAVSPGLIMTDSTRAGLTTNSGALNEENVVVRRIPLRRPAEEEEVVAPVLYFCSAAADYTSGTTIYVDGAYRHNTCPENHGSIEKMLSTLKETVT